MPTNVLIIDALIGDTGVSETANVQSILSEESGDYNFITINLKQSHIALEQIVMADRIIISGSPQTAFQKGEYVSKLEQAFLYILNEKKHCLAICFGAQCLAQYLGAKILLHPKGTEFGTIKLSLTEAGNTDSTLGVISSKPLVHSTHNDYIASLPPGTTLLAYNDHSPIQAYRYQNILGTQFHPDIPVSVITQLLESRREKYLANGTLQNAEAYEKVKQTLGKGIPGHQILRQFLQA